MQPIRNRNLLIGFYVTILFFLLMSVIATPLLIRHGIPFTRNFIVEEETVETGLIIILFGISFIILRSFMHSLKTYRRMVERAGKEKSRLVSRLAEAFSYIGTVNVELQEIASVLCGVTCYPQSRKTFRQLIDKTAAKAMAVAATPWLVVRMIDRNSGNTLDEHAVERPGIDLPKIILGNRAILDGRTVDGIQTIVSRQQNLDLVTVFILPSTGRGDDMSDERTILLSAILNQIEMLFMLFRSGCLKRDIDTEKHPREIYHDSSH